jgi:hypothetical protein
MSRFYICLNAGSEPFITTNPQLAAGFKIANAKACSVIQVDGEFDPQELEFSVDDTELEWRY